MGIQHYFLRPVSLFVYFSSQNNDTVFLVKSFLDSNTYDRYAPLIHSIETECIMQLSFSNSSYLITIHHTSPATLDNV